MGLSTATQAEIALKFLLGKAQTAISADKGPNNEAEPIFLVTPSNIVWTSTINSNPTIAISEGVAEYVIATLVPDVTSNGRAFFANYPTGHPLEGQRIKNAISPSFGVDYEAKPYGGAALIPPGDNRNWIYEYQAGIFFQETANASPVPTSIRLYVYTGNILSQSNELGINLLSLPARVATTQEIVLSGLQTIDDISLNLGDRVLVKNQSDLTKNGIYEVSNSSWTRSSDLNTWLEVKGATVFVSEGTINSDSTWMVSKPLSIGVIDSSPIVWAKLSGSSKYFPGGGLVLNGFTFSIEGYTTLSEYGITDAEPTITAGTSLQYWRGDKTFQTLDTSVVTENGNLYFTNNRVDSRVQSYTGDVTLSGTTFSIGANKVTNSMLVNSTISGIALGNNLANLTASDTTLTLNGPYNGSLARTIGLNLSNSNTWTANQIFSRTITGSLNSSVSKIYFVGDSITVGYGLSDSSLRFATILSNQLKCVEVNNGITGLTMQNGTPAGYGGSILNQLTVIPSYDNQNSYLFIMLGTNDILINTASYTPSGFETAYQTVINNATGKGWPTSRIVLMTPPNITNYNYGGGNSNATIHQQYNTVVKNISTSNNTLFLDTYTLSLNNSLSGSLLQSDGVHVNVLGNKMLAAFESSLFTQENTYGDAQITGQLSVGSIKDATQWYSAIRTTGNTINDTVEIGYMNYNKNVSTFIEIFINNTDTSMLLPIYLGNTYGPTGKHYFIPVNSWMTANTWYNIRANEVTGLSSGWEAANYEGLQLQMKFVTTGYTSSKFYFRLKSLRSGQTQTLKISLRTNDQAYSSNFVETYTTSNDATAYNYFGASTYWNNAGEQVQNWVPQYFYDTIISSSSITATSFIKNGGSSSQFLKADGSIDSSTYLTTGSASGIYVPLTRTVAGFALSSDVTLASLTATDSTLTFSGAYNGSTARTIGLNLGNANTWTAKQIISPTSSWTASSTPVNAPLQVGTTNNAGGISFARSTSGVLTGFVGFAASNEDIEFRIANASSSGIITFFTGTSGGTERARFSPTGNLLLGSATDAGTGILQVTGNSSFIGQATFSPSLSGNFALGTVITPTLTATANNQTNVALQISPTFNNGSFTGVNNIALNVNGLASFGGNVNISAAGILSVGSSASGGTYGTAALNVNGGIYAGGVSNLLGGLFASITAGTAFVSNTIRATASSALSNQLTGLNVSTTTTATSGTTPVYATLQINQPSNNTGHTITNGVTGIFFQGSSATNNTTLLIGNGSAPTGNWGVYNVGSYANYFASKIIIGTTTDAGYTAFDFNGTGRFQGATTFTATPTIQSASQATIQYYSTGAGVDAKYWNTYADSFGYFRIQGVNDALNSTTDYVRIIRSGATSATFNLLNLGSQLGQLQFTGAGQNGVRMNFSGGAAYIQNTGSSNEQLNYNASSYHWFGIGGTETYRFDSIGLILGAANTGAAARLDVRGNINQQNTVTVTGTNYNTPSVIFQGDYRVFGVPNTYSSMAGSGMVVGTYTNVAPTGGSGTGLLVTVVVSSSSFATISATTAGTGYLVGDVLSIPNTALGGTTGTQTTTVLQVTSSNSQSDQNATVLFRNYLAVANSGAEASAVFTPTARFEVLNRSNQAIASPLLIGLQWAGGSNPFMAFRYNNINMMTFGSSQPFFRAGFTSDAASTFNSTTAFNGIATFSGGSPLSANLGITVNNTISNSPPLSNYFNIISSNYRPQTMYATNSTQVRGAVATLSVSSGGSGGTNGTNVGLTFTGGSGTGLQILGTIVGGVLVSAQYATNQQAMAGAGYAQGDVLTITNQGLVGATVTVNLITLPTVAYNANDIFNSNGANNYFAFYGTPTVNQTTGATGNIYGFYWNPTVTSLLGRNIAFQNTTGDVIHNSTSGNVLIGTTTNAGTGILQVTGNSSFTGTLKAGGNSASGTPAQHQLVTSISTNSTGLFVETTSTYTGASGFNGVLSYLNLTASGTGKNSAFSSFSLLQGSSNQTTVIGYNAAINDSSSGTLTNGYGFYNQTAVNNNGGSITNLYGVYFEEQTVATNIYGLYSVISSGATKWNLYLAGTAKSYMAGTLLIGTTTDAGNGILQITGNSQFTGDVTSNRYYVNIGTTAVSALGSNGQIFDLPTGRTIRDNSSSSGSTIANVNTFNLSGVTYTANNATVTITNAATLSLSVPIAGAGIAITNSWALYVNNGNSYFNGTITSSSNVISPLHVVYGIGDASATNFELGKLSWNANRFMISTERGGTGITRSLYLVSGFGGGALPSIEIGGSTAYVTIGGAGQANGLAVAHGMNVTSTVQYCLGVTSTINASSTGSYRALYISPYLQTNTTTGNKLLADIGYNTASGSAIGTHTSYFNIDSSGVNTFNGVINITNAATNTTNFYETATADPTNYSRLFIGYANSGGSNGNYIIGSQAAGTGTTRGIRLAWGYGGGGLPSLTVSANNGSGAYVEVGGNGQGAGLAVNSSFTASAFTNYMFGVISTINSTGSAGYRAFYVSPYLQTNTGSGVKLLMDIGTNTAANGAVGTHSSIFSLTTTGIATLTGTFNIGSNGSYNLFNSASQTTDTEYLSIYNSSNTFYIKSLQTGAGASRDIIMQAGSGIGLVLTNTLSNLGYFQVNRNLNATGTILGLGTSSTMANANGTYIGVAIGTGVNVSGTSTTTQLLISPYYQARGTNGDWLLRLGTNSALGASLTTHTDLLTVDYLGNMNITGRINSSSTQLTVSGSTSGSAVFSQPLAGSTMKQVVIYLNALNGTASYTFPVAFTNTPVVMSSDGLATSIVTAKSTSSVTVTGTTTTGILILLGY